ncbi:hypothetical protein BFC22_03350 [Carnobacterium divergens]|uniref:YfhO family protein n=1 Tax=Carnobacterium divergens TaxID=2748 RepID=UPI000E73FFBF|nr:YfhO family protein [Carnobacterium divergens]ANZ99197.1 hypothetical protein BFC22_03350 [Carnobacterium divergens]
MLMKKMQQLNKKQLVSFLMPLFILVPIFISKGIVPFGDANLLVSDLGTQYVPFFAQLKAIFFGEGSLLYSFSSGMGDSFLPLAAYYLMSPFNLIFLFVSQTYLSTAVTYVLFLKIACMSGSMYYYLRKTYHRNDFSQLFFAMIYALSGYVGIYMYNIMWMDALIFLPLLALGIQWLVDEGRTVFYCLILFSTIFTNYYLGYMTCIFALMYFIYWTVVRTNYQSWKEYISINKSNWLKFMGYSLIGAGLNGVILAPAVFGMLKTGKSVIDWHIFLPTPLFGLEIFTQLGIDHTNFQTRLEHLPSFFVGSFVLILAIAFFFLKKVSKKDKWGNFALIGFIFLSFWLQLFNTIWHMFQETAGFPYRNSYMLSFLLIKLAYETWLKRDEISASLIGKICFSLIVLLGIGYFYSNYFSTVGEKLDSRLFWISILFISINGCLIGWSKLSERKQILLFLIVAVEIGVNFEQMLRATPFESESRFRSDMIELTNLIDPINEKDSDLYRMDNSIQGIDNGYNSSFLYNYHSTPYYSSTLNDSLRKTLENLGLNSKNERRISSVGQTELLDYLFNVRYKISEEESGNAVIHRIHEAFPTSLGYVVPEEIKSVHFMTKSPFENQNKITANLTKNGEEIFKPVVVKKETNNEYRFTAENDGTAYLYLPNNKMETIEVYMNNRLIAPKVAIRNQALLNLGELKKGESANLVFKTKDEIIIDSTNIQILDETVLNQVKDQLKKKRWMITDWKDNHIRATVDIKDNDNLLYMSIPYDKNWVVKVDGKKIKADRVLDDFMGISLSKGSHQIELSFIPKGFLFGSVISLMSLISLLSLELFKKREGIKN